MFIKGNQSIRANDRSMIDFQTLKIEHLSVFLSLLQVQLLYFQIPSLVFICCVKLQKKLNFYENGKKVICHYSTG